MRAGNTMFHLSLLLILAVFRNFLQLYSHESVTHYIPSLWLILDICVWLLLLSCMRGSKLSNAFILNHANNLSYERFGDRHKTPPHDPLYKRNCMLFLIIVSYTIYRTIDAKIRSLYTFSITFRSAHDLFGDRDKMLFTFLYNQLVSRVSDLIIYLFI